MAPLIVAPQAAGLPSTPYLTVDEYQASPNAVDLSTVYQSAPEQVRDAIATEIGRASSWMDRFCHYTLGATLDTELAQTRIRNDGTVEVVTRGIPVLEVDTFQIGITPSSLADVTAGAAADAWLEDNVIKMPAYTSIGRDGYNWGLGLGNRVYCLFTYVNGYPNTLLADPASEGAESITVASALGIYAGTTLTVFDAGQNEVVQVAASYAGGSTLPLSSALLFGHSAQVSVSALPPVAKEACVFATNGFIRNRGADTLAMSSLEVPETTSTSNQQPGLADLQEAEKLLATFVLPTWG